MDDGTKSAPEFRRYDTTPRRTGLRPTTPFEQDSKRMQTMHLPQRDALGSLGTLGILRIGHDISKHYSDIIHLDENRIDSISVVRFTLWLQQRRRRFGRLDLGFSNTLVQTSRLVFVRRLHLAPAKSTRMQLVGSDATTQVQNREPRRRRASPHDYSNVLDATTHHPISHEYSIQC